MLDSFTSRGKAGAVLIAVGILLLLAGMIGYTLTERSRMYQHQIHPIRPFADDPLPENVLSPLFAAELTITWDRDDVWMGLVDADERSDVKTCQQLLHARPRCDGTSTNFVAGDSGATAAKDSVGTWSQEHTSQLSAQKMVPYLLEQKCRVVWAYRPFIAEHTGLVRWHVCRGF